MLFKYIHLSPSGGIVVSWPVRSSMRKTSLDSETLNMLILDHCSSNEIVKDS